MLRGRIKMACNFFFEDTYYFTINNISVIGNFNNYNPKLTPLIREKGTWICNVNLPKGKYLYKFYINKSLKLNDPMAKCYLKDNNGEVWSVALVNHQNKREIIESSNHISIIDKVVTNRVYDDLRESKRKLYFNRYTDSKVFAGFELGNILGLHAITAIWINPNSCTHHISEHTIEVKKDDKNNSTIVWFWLDLQEKLRDYPKGMWKIKLFINGKYIIEDYVSIGTGYIYSATNKGIEFKYL